MYLTGEITSANALVLGDARLRLTRQICGIFRFYLYPNRILVLEVYLVPPQRLTEAALAGALLGSLQGILFVVIVPVMGPIRDNEWTKSVVLILLMLVVGTFAGEGLSFIAAYLNENRRENP